MLVLMALVTTAMTAPLLWAVWLRHEGKSQAPDTLEMPDENYLSHPVHSISTGGDDDPYEAAVLQLSTSDFHGGDDAAKGAREAESSSAISPTALLGVSSV